MATDPKPPVWVGYLWPHDGIVEFDLEDGTNPVPSALIGDQVTVLAVDADHAPENWDEALELVEEAAYIRGRQSMARELLRLARLEGVTADPEGADDGSV